MKPTSGTARTGFGPDGAHQALEEIRKHLRSGYHAVYDVDLKGYFDSIPYEPLFACVRMRVVDRAVLHLIRLWLSAPVWEVAAGAEEGLKIERPQKCTPKGGVISPLLANVYLHWFDVLFHRTAGPAIRYGARLVRYADDFVVLAKQAEPGIEAFLESTLVKWMDLEINREKTRTVDLNAKKTSVSVQEGAAARAATTP